MRVVRTKHLGWQQGPCPAEPQGSRFESQGQWSQLFLKHVISRAAGYFCLAIPPPSVNPNMTTTIQPGTLHTLITHSPPEHVHYCTLYTLHARIQFVH